MTSASLDRAASAAARRGFPARPELLANIVAGLVVGTIAIALAVAVGVAPIAGLYTAIFAGATAAMLGGSSFNITGSTAALVPIRSHVVLVHGGWRAADGWSHGGVLLLGMSLLRLGRLIRFRPGPVIVGFTGGIALSIAVMLQAQAAPPRTRITSVHPEDHTTITSPILAAPSGLDHLLRAMTPLT